MKLPYVLISIQTSAATAPPDIGRRFIEELIACDERLTPEYLSTDESYKDRYEGVDHFVSNWWAMLARTTGPNTSPSESYWGPLWKRKRKIRSSGHIEHGFINKKIITCPAVSGLSLAGTNISIIPAYSERGSVFSNLTLPCCTYSLIPNILVM